MSVLDAVRQERDQLIAETIAKIKQLDEIEQLAAEYVGEPLEQTAGIDDLARLLPAGKPDAEPQPRDKATSTPRGRVPDRAPGKAAQSGRTRRPALTVELALEPVRSALISGPHSFQALVKGALGYTRTARTDAIVRQVLEQLGAVQDGRRWALPKKPAAQKPAALPSVATSSSRPGPRDPEQIVVAGAMLDAAGLDEGSPERDSINAGLGLTDTDFKVARELESDAVTTLDQQVEQVEQAYLERAILREISRQPYTPEELAAAIDAPVAQVQAALDRMRGRRGGSR